VISPLLGSLFKSLSSGAPPADDPLVDTRDRDKRQMFEVVFGRMAPQAEQALSSPHAGKIAGAATIVAGAFLLPKLIGVVR
jgi:hypothetical protein